MTRRVGVPWPEKREKSRSEMSSTVGARIEIQEIGGLRGGFERHKSGVGEACSVAVTVPGGSMPGIDVILSFF